MLKKIVAGILTGCILITSTIPAVLAQGSKNPYIKGTDLELENEKSNLDYSKQEEWEKVFPNGTFIVEHSEYTVKEGGDDPENPSDTYLAIKVARMGGRNSKIDVKFAVGALTASEDEFEVQNDTLTFMPGEEEKIAYIKIKDDNIHENDEFLTFALVDAGNGHLGQLTTAMIRILDNEEYIETSINVSVDKNIDKSKGKATITLTRSQEQAPYFFSVDIATKDGSAKAGVDYEETKTSVVFAEGEIEKQIDVPLIQTHGKQAKDVIKFYVELSNPKGGKIAVGSSKVTVALTDTVPDETNLIHNTENMLAELKENNQIDEIKLDKTDVTKNSQTVTLNENNEMVDRGRLVKNAMSVFNGTAALQPYNNSYWNDEIVVYQNNGKNFGDVFYLAASGSGYGKYKGGNNFDDGGWIDQNDVDALYVTHNTFDMNMYRKVKTSWRNESDFGIGTTMKPCTMFGYVTNQFNLGNVGSNLSWKGSNNSDSYRNNIKSYDNDNFNRTDEYDLNHVAYGHGTDSRANRFYYSVYNSSNGDYNEFKVNNLKLERAYVPFSVFKNAPGVSNFSCDQSQTMSFKKDGFAWTITAVAGQGGFKPRSSGSYDNGGIYAGSKLKITLKPVDNSSDAKAITKISLYDQKNQQHALGGTIDFLEGSFSTTIMMKTENTNISSADYIGNAYTFVPNGKALSFKAEAQNYRMIDVDVTNANQLSNYKDNVTKIVTFNNGNKLSLESSGFDSSNSNKYKYGSYSFESIIIDPTVMGKNIRITTNIPGYERIENKAITIPMDKCLEVSGRIILNVYDQDLSYFEPTSNIMTRSVQRKHGEQWESRVFIPTMANSVLHEELHEKQQKPIADALTFDLLITNTKNKETAESKKFPIEIYRVDENEMNQTPLFTFVHDTKIEQPTASNTIGKNKAIEVSEVDKYYYSEKGSKGGFPEVKLKSVGPMGNVYTVYIPSYHNYMEDIQTVPTVFEGEQFVEFKMYENTSLEKIENHDLGAVKLFTKGISIKSPLPNDVMAREEESSQTKYHEDQKKMYVYNNNNASMSLPALEFDFTQLTESLGSPISAGPGISLDGNQITIGFTLSGTPLEKTWGQEVTTQDQLQEMIKNAKNLKPGSGFNPSGTSGTANSKSASFGISGGFSVTLDYDELQAKWIFGECMFALGGEVGYSLQYPIPSFPIIFLSMGINGGLEISSGFRQVPTGFNDAGQMERQIIFSGIKVSPSAYFSVGVGFGVANALSVTFSGFVRGGFETTFAQTEVTMGSDRYDIVPEIQDAKNKKFIFNGQWEHQTKVAGAYNQTLAKTSTNDANVTIELDAKSFNLSGMLHPNGAMMKIKVFDRDNNLLLHEKTVDTSYSKEQLGARLFTYETTNIRKLRVEISVDNSQGNQDGKYLALDEINFKVMDELYQTSTIPAEFGDWNVDIGLNLSVKLLVFSFGIDLIYFYVNQDGVGVKYPNSPKQANQLESGVGIIPRTTYTDASGRLRAVNTEDYFNLGNYTDNKTKNIVDEQIIATSQSQIYTYNGKTYRFWVDDPGSSVRSNDMQRLILQYQEEGGEIKYVEDDGTNDYEFFVTTNSKGQLQVVWASFKEGIEVPEFSDTFEMMKFYNNQMEIKTAVMDENGNFKNVQIIKGTDDDRGDTLPQVATNGRINAISFVKDEKGKFDANVQINQESFDGISQQNQEGMESFMNSMYQGIATNYISIDNGNGFSKAQKVPLGLDESYWKVGTKITSTSLEFLDDQTLVLAFTAEIPNAQQKQFLGTNKVLFIQYGTISDKGNVEFESAQLVSSIFDYDNSLVEVYGDNIPKEYQGNDGLYEDPVLLQAKLKKVSVPSDGTKATDQELTLFYKVNEEIQFINEESLKAIGGIEKGSKTKQTISLPGNEYDINVTQDGRLYIIYSQPSKEGYNNQLMIKLYDSIQKVWGESQVLTYSDAFSQEALDAHLDTGSVGFHKFTSSIDAQDNLKLLVQTTYTPFAYDRTIVNDQGVNMVVPYLNELDSWARRQLYQIDFDKPETKVVGTQLELGSEMFTKGNEFDIDFSIKNVGDTTLNNVQVNLMMSNERIAVKDLSGSFVPGATHDLNHHYLVSDNQIVDGTKLYYTISTNGQQIYSSLDDDYYYEIKTDKAELTFKEYWMNVNDRNEVEFAASIENIGHKQLSGAATVEFEVLKENLETGLLELDTSVGQGGIIHREMIVAESIDLLNMEKEVFETQYNLNGKFVIPAELSANQFTLRMKIGYAEEEYSKDNNYSRNFILYPKANIITGYEDENNILTVNVGEDIILDQLRIDSTMANVNRSNLEIQEVGSNCLSIDSTSEIPVIRVMSAPKDEGISQVRVAFTIKDTVISDSLILNINRQEVKNFTGDSNLDGVSYINGGWNKIITSLENGYIGFNQDVIETDGVKDQAIKFKFQGSSFSLFGDKSLTSGKLKVLIKEEGNSTSEVEETINLNDKVIQRNIEIYSKQELDRDKKYEVTLIPIISEQQSIILDRVVFDGIIQDLPKEQAFNIVKQADYDMDVPVTEGRSRKATVKVNFDKEVIPVLDVNMTDFNLIFDIIETDDVTGEKTKVGEQLFIYSGLSNEGKTVEFSANNLVSKTGKTIVYQLQDTQIAEGFLTSIKGETITRDIPNATQVAFELSESKILKVSVIDDDENADGTIKKSIQVTFEKNMNKERLAGTKIIYKDENNQLVEFEFVKLLDDGINAIYRSAITLADDETEKMLVFDKGIVLRDNYALISADNNFVDGKITIDDTAILDFNYQKPKVVKAPTLERNIQTDISSVGERIVSKITFDQPVSIENLGSNASVQVKQTIIDQTKEQPQEKIITLVSDVISKDKKTITFISEEKVVYQPDKQVTYEFVSDEINYQNEKSIVSQKEKIKVNSKFTIKPEKLIFDTTANIVKATVSNDGIGKDALPKVTVLFNTKVNYETLVNSTITVQEIKTLYDGTEIVIDRELKFKEIMPASGDVHQAVYGYDLADGLIVFDQNEQRKQFVFAQNPTITTDGSSEVYNYTNNIMIYPQIPATEAKDAYYQKVKANEAILTRSEVIEGQGNQLTLDITYDKPFIITNMENVQVVLNKLETGKEATTIVLQLVAFDLNTNTLRFQGIDTLYSYNKSVHYTLPEIIDGLDGNGEDEYGVSPSIYIKGLTDLLIANDKGKAVETKFDDRDISEESIVPKLKVTFDQNVDPDSFKSSSVDARLITNTNDNKQQVEIVTLNYAGVENGITVVYELLNQAISEDVISIRFELNSNINSKENLLDDKNTIILSTKLSRCEIINYVRPQVESVAFQSKQEKPYEFGFNKTSIIVKFTKPIEIKKQDLNAITLNAQAVTTKDGQTLDQYKLVYRATKQLDETTVVFACDVNDYFKGRRLVDISLTESAFQFVTDNVIKDAANTNMHASSIVPQANEQFEVSAIPLEQIIVNQGQPGMFLENKNYTYQVSLEPSDADDVELTWNSSDESVVTVNNNGTITTHKSGKAVIAVSFGEISTEIPIIVDSILPSILLPVDMTSWSTIPISIPVTVSDSLSGVKFARYKTNEDKPQSGNIVLSKDQGIVTMSNDGEYELTVFAEDKLGNYHEDKIKIMIDKVVPTIQVTGNPDKPVQEATLKVETTAGVSGYGVTVNGKALEGKEYKVTENGTYRFVITNGAGVSREEVVEVTNIDREKPVLSIETNSYKDNSWSNKDVELTVGNKVDNLGKTKLEYRLNENEWQIFDGNLKIVNDTVNAYQFKATSESGVVSEIVTFTVKVDKTKPTEAKIEIKENSFKEFLNTITFGIFFNETVDVKIKGNCDISGEKEIAYQIVKNDASYQPEGEWAKYNSAFSMKPNDKFVVYAKVTDNAGNEVIVNTDGIVLDETAPEIIGVEENGVYYIDRLVEYADSYGEIESAKLNEQLFDNRAWVLEPGKYTITVVDKAKNESTLSFTMMEMPKVDKLLLKDLAKIEAIRAEFEQQKSKLSENRIKELETVISSLEARMSELVNIDNVSKLINDLSSVISREEVLEVISAQKAYDRLTEKEKSEFSQKLIEKLEKAKQQVAKLIHTSKEVSVTGLPWYVGIEIIPLDVNSNQGDLFKEKLINQSILSMYAIKLNDLYHGGEYKAERIDLQYSVPKVEIDGYGTQQIAFIEGGILQILQPKEEENLIFTLTSEVNEFAIVAKKIPAKSGISTGDKLPLLQLGVICIGAIAVLFCLKKKRV